MPNRIVREGINSSEAVCSLDWAAEVFYRRLMSVVDDYGRYEANPSLLRAKCYPLQVDRVREADISRWMAACQTAGLIVLYQGVKDGKTKHYLQITNFGQQTRTPSKFPSFDNKCQQMLSNAHLDVSVVVSGVEGEGGEGAFAQVPHAEFQKAWNELGQPFANLAAWNSKRQGWLKARWADEFFRKNWQAALQRVKASDFCRGSNDRGWIADVEFFLRPDSVAKILEGKYDNRGNVRKQEQVQQKHDAETRRRVEEAKQRLLERGLLPDGKVPT